MLIRLSKNNETVILSVNSNDKDAVTLILQQAQWIITHVSETNTELLRFDLQIAVPSLTIEDVEAIKKAMKHSDRYFTSFVEICNILVRNDRKIFSVMPCVNYKL